jgi:hypothetical protein
MGKKRNQRGGTGDGSQSTNENSKDTESEWFVEGGAFFDVRQLCA